MIKFIGAVFAAAMCLLAGFFALSILIPLISGAIAIAIVCVVFGLIIALVKGASR